VKVLVTGASGRLAPFVIRELRDEYEIVLSSRRQPDEEFADLPWVQGDLADAEHCAEAVKGAQAIQHLGAQPGPVDHPSQKERSIANGVPLDATFKTNMLGTYYLMQAAVDEGVKTVVMCGSNCSLGHGFRISGDPFPIESLPIDETHECFPEDSYSYSKRAGEDLLAMYARAYGMRCLTTRPAGITPPERRASMRENAGPAGGWSDWLWCWVGSEDVASAHRMLMEAADELPPYGTYFLNGNDTTSTDLSLDIVRAHRPDLLPVAEGLSGHDSFLSNAKLRAAVGWEHKTSWRDPE
jgi:UDP-glucose 4-epimerase